MWSFTSSIDNGRAKLLRPAYVVIILRSIGNVGDVVDGQEETML